MTEAAGRPALRGGSPGRAPTSLLGDTIRAEVVLGIADQRTLDAVVELLGADAASKPVRAGPPASATSAGAVPPYSIGTGLTPIHPAPEAEGESTGDGRTVSMREPTPGGRRPALPASLVLRFGGLTPAAIAGRPGGTRYAIAAAGMVVFAAFVILSGLGFVLIDPAGAAGWASFSLLAAVIFVIFSRFLLADTPMETRPDNHATGTPEGRSRYRFIPLAIILLVAVAISQPAAILVFHSKVDAELAIEARSLSLEQLARVDRNLAEGSRQITAQIDDLRQQRVGATRTVNAAARDYVIEITGSGPAGRAGLGPVALLKKEALDGAQAQLIKVNAELDVALRTRNERLAAVQDTAAREARSVKIRPIRVGGFLNEETALWKSVMTGSPWLVLGTVALFLVPLVVGIGSWRIGLSAQRAEVSGSAAPGRPRGLATTDEAVAEISHGNGNRWSRFFWRLSGFDPSFLDDPADRVFASSAAVLLMVCGLGAAAGLITAQVAANGHVSAVAVAMSLAVGTVCFLYDRLFLTYIPVNLESLDPAAPPLRRHSVTGYLIRCATAIIIAVAVSQPLLLQIFHTEIQDELVTRARAERDASVTQITRKFAVDISALSDQLAPDVEWVSLAQSETTRIRGELEVQRAGKGIGPSGDGSVERTLASQLADATAAFEQAQARLAADQTVVSQQTSRLNGEISATEGRLPARSKFGILERESVLFDVMSRSPAALASFIPVSATLALLGLGVPILRLAGGTRQYDLALAENRRAALRRATGEARGAAGPGRGDASENRGPRRRRASDALFWFGGVDSRYLSDAADRSFHSTASAVPILCGVVFFLGTADIVPTSGWLWTGARVAVAAAVVVNYRVVRVAVLSDPDRPLRGLGYPGATVFLMTVFLASIIVSQSVAFRFFATDIDTERVKEKRSLVVRLDSAAEHTRRARVTALSGPLAADRVVISRAWQVRSEARGDLIVFDQVSGHGPGLSTASRFTLLRAYQQADAAFLAAVANEEKRAASVRIAITANTAELQRARDAADAQATADKGVLARERALNGLLRHNGAASANYLTLVAVLVLVGLGALFFKWFERGSISAWLAASRDRRPSETYAVDPSPDLNSAWAAIGPDGQALENAAGAESDGAAHRSEDHDDADGSAGPSVRPVRQTWLVPADRPLAGESRPTPGWLRLDGELLPRAGARRGAATGTGTGSVPALLPRGTRRSFISESLAVTRWEGQIDVPTIVNRIARGQPLTALPRQPRRTNRLGVQLLLDVGPAMEPFLADVAALPEQIARVVGAPRLRILRFAGCPSRGAGARARPWPRYELPAAGTPVLIVTDFTQRSPWGPPPAPVVEWVSFLAQLRRAGARPLALVPSSPVGVDRRIATLLPVVAWDRARPSAAVRVRR